MIVENYVGVYPAVPSSNMSGRRKIRRVYCCSYIEADTSWFELTSQEENQQVVGAAWWKSVATLTLKQSRVDWNTRGGGKSAGVPLNEYLQYFADPLPRPDRGNFDMCRLAGLGGAANSSSLGVAACCFPPLSPNSGWIEKVKSTLQR